VANDRNGTRATAEVDGAIATTGGGVFLANRVNDAFAVVDTGVPGVGVFYENRPVGTTDSGGRLLIPGLRSYQSNKIAIDTGNLPVDADIVASQDVVAPADRSGALVKFHIRTNTNSAVLVLNGPDGKPVPVGARGQVDNGDAFVVGYDGRAFVKGLQTRNTVSVVLPDRQCRASFTYTPRPGEQVVISPVACE
jgi:outer membrane usher protein